MKILTKSQYLKYPEFGSELKPDVIYRTLTDTKSGWLVSFKGKAIDPTTGVLYHPVKTREKVKIIHG